MHRDRAAAPMLRPAAPGVVATSLAAPSLAAPSFTSRGDGSRTAAVAAVGLIVAVLGPVLILAAPARAVTVPAALLFAALGFGPAVTSWLDTGDRFAQLALTVAVSLAGYAALAALLIWARLWHPDLTLLLALPSGVSCLLRLLSRPPMFGANHLTIDVD